MYYIHEIGGNGLTTTPIIANVDNVIEMSSETYDVKRQGSES